MTMSQTSFLAEVINIEENLPEGKLAYFRERQKNALYDFIVSGFLEKERMGELSRASLARRINKKPEQITRWLNTPGNWTLDTVSDLMLGIFGSELKFSEHQLSNNRATRNFNQTDALDVGYSFRSTSTSFSAKEIKIQQS